MKAKYYSVGWKLTLSMRPLLLLNTELVWPINLKLDAPVTAKCRAHTEPSALCHPVGTRPIRGWIYGASSASNAQDFILKHKSHKRAQKEDDKIDYTAIHTAACTIIKHIGFLLNT